MILITLYVHLILTLAKYNKGEGQANNCPFISNEEV